MQYFIAIVPPDDYKDQITSFRNRWEHHRLNEVAEPHITVKAQGGLTADLTWLDKVKVLCSSVQRFQLTFIEPSAFGKEVVFLGVRSKEIYEFHRLLVGTVAPPSELIKQYFELDEFHPHLTLGQTHWGMQESEVEEMKLTSKHALAPFPTFMVTHVRVYQEVEPNRYAPFEDIPLTR
ncbi:2'-5' RNA ligase [Paenibacillus sp. Root52]|uniref:2'-5' RNA ligase family protein n=1 Tax=Paenibacillus sp. Root52 TaxID=1736552 RepID=UPI0007005A76|nr:2'-5' RNA ligase family protein [Paenibacillus sp. Root52]KQY94739.1 2'-5' RNA ligase [Paenibacillus sp. Root52]